MTNGPACRRSSIGSKRAARDTSAAFTSYFIQGPSALLKKALKCDAVIGTPIVSARASTVLVYRRANTVLVLIGDAPLSSLTKPVPIALDAECVESRNW